MKHRLVIAEKPSVAALYAKVLGAGTKKDGYYEGGGYKVSWCVGHLVQMAGPEAYDERYAKWSIKDLPIIPKEYMYEVSKNTKKQYMVLKKLMNDKEVTSVVNACDAGREGELIFLLVYIKAGCTKKRERLWLSSMEEEAVREGFKNLRPEESMKSLAESALARSKADWLVGMNLSRLYSCLYNQNYSVGRVQTPTLAMIGERDMEIEGFKKEKYFTVEVMAGGITFTTDRIDSISDAEKTISELPKEVTVSEVAAEDKVTKPGKPYDLTTLQREANKLYGFSAKQTLDYLQSLYEKKLVTYPRTDSRYLTGDMKEKARNLILLLGGNIESEKNFDTIFDSSKVSDHYAIIPTELSAKNGVDSLPESEKKIYTLVKTKLLMAASDNLTESTVKVFCKGGSTTFHAAGKTITEEGFTSWYKVIGVERKKETVFPKVKKGDTLTIKKEQLTEKFTKPPRHFTEETLLKAMENAGTEALEKGAEVERKGLGTPATRAGIIETLIYRKLLERDKKNLRITHKGLALISVVSDSFRSAKTTAEWEMKLSEIAKGKMEAKAFLKDIEDEIKELVKSYMNLEETR